MHCHRDPAQHGGCRHQAVRDAATADDLGSYPGTVRQIEDDRGHQAGHIGAVDDRTRDVKDRVRASGPRTRAGRGGALA